jgi:hypothetical protein
MKDIKKNKQMKNLKILGLLIIALLGFNSCETQDDVVFIAQETEGFVFTNSTQANYILTTGTASNLAERFTWNNADFEVPTNITYELQRSIMGDFSDLVVLGSTNGNELAVTIGQMMSIATEAGLDANPNTAEPNTGAFSVRLRAYVGNGGSTEVFSDVKTISVELLENTGGGSGITPSTWGVVGSGYNNWGAFADGVFYTTSTADVFVAYVTLVTGEIKFRENNDWGNNFGDTGADGTLDAGGDNIAVTAGNYKITLNLSNNTYTMEAFSWGVVGSGYNDWGNAGPDAKFYYDYTTDTFKVGVKLLTGDIKFRMNNTWVTDFGDTGADGTLDAGGDNIAVTAGHYTISLDFNAGTYSIDTDDVWGVVGSGYNNWGATPDFALTETEPDVWVGDIATFVAGEIKFRINNDWGTNYGDTGADGTLDDGGDNIAVTAGLYRVKLDLANGTYKLNKVQ